MAKRICKPLDVSHTFADTICRRPYFRLIAEFWPVAAVRVTTCSTQLHIPSLCDTASQVYQARQLDLSRLLIEKREAVSCYAVYDAHIKTAKHMVIYTDRMLPIRVIIFVPPSFACAHTYSHICATRFVCALFVHILVLPN